MTITGELWTALEQMNANNIRKWLYGTVLIRDWDPAGTTTLAGFTPFETDGSLKTTLFDDTNPGGRWFDVGAIEALPLVDVPGTNAKSILSSVGASDFSVQYSTTPQIIYRQLLIIGVDGELENPIYVAEMRPRVSIVSLGKKGRMFNAKTQDCFDLSFGVYVDPASGFAKNALYGGSAWLALGGPVVLPADKTVTATNVATDSATLVFNEPTSPNQPFTYSVESDNTTTSTVAAVPSGNVTTSVSNGVVTLTVSGLTASDQYTFTVTAKAANLQTAAYTVSNSVTITV